MPAEPRERPRTGGSPAFTLAAEVQPMSYAFRAGTPGALFPVTTRPAPAG
ncbi:hypothetical protein ACWDCX_13750 [Streptomyces fungicidicus]